jgi:hypothetical protein
MPSLANMKKSPMSDEDIRKVLGSNVKILKYSELANYNNINELLSKPVDAVVILYEMHSIQWSLGRTWKTK